MSVRGIVVAACVAVACLGPGAAGGAAAGLGLVDIGTFSAPIYATGSASDPSRLYVVQRGGQVFVLRDGQKSLFADLSGYVAGTDGERGLLSIALAPDFATSHRFYAYLTAKPPLVARTGNIAIVRVTAASEDSAAGATPELLLQVPHDLQSNHNGGTLQFGPDGFLYAGTGDGGSADDPSGNGQYLAGDPSSATAVDGVNHSQLLGKILRLDVSGATGAAPAPGNDFGRGEDPRIWAYGVRNPYRFSFDRSTGDLLIGDVGQNTREEVDLLPKGTPAGTNLGWDAWEGTLAHEGSPSRAGFTFPVLEYSHGDGSDGKPLGCSITGGYVVRDPGVPELDGQYLYGDYCSSRLRAATLTASGSTGDHDLGIPLAPQSLVSFGEDGYGRVLVVGLDGSVRRLVGSGPDPAAAASGGGTGTGPGAGSAAGTGAAPDRTPPVLTVVSGSRAQRALRTNRLAVTLRCDERCSVRAGGRFVVARRSSHAARLAVQQQRRTLEAGARVRLSLRFSARTRASLGAALRAHRAVSARVLVVVADTAGNQTARTLTIRLRR